MILDMAAKPKKRKGIGSEVEDRFDNLLKEHGVKGYKRNVRFIPGRRFLADFWFPELRLAIEVDGGLWMKTGGHTSGVGAHRDRERDILAYLTEGILTFRVGTDHLKNGDAITWVKEIIEKRKAELNVSEDD